MTYTTFAKFEAWRRNSLQAAWAAVVIINRGCHRWAESLMPDVRRTSSSLRPSYILSVLFRNHHVHPLSFRNISPFLSLPRHTYYPSPQPHPLLFSITTLYPIPPLPPDPLFPNPPSNPSSLHPNRSPSHLDTTLSSLFILLPPPPLFALLFIPAYTVPPILHRPRPSCMPFVPFSPPPLISH